MPAPTRFDAPAPLVVAASLAAVEGLVIGVYGLLELLHVSPGRVTMGLTTAVFFAAYGALLVLCGWQLTRRAAWARGPVLLAQLIQLGLAWNFRDDPTTLIAVGLAVVGLVVIAGLFHPATTQVLEEDARLEG